VHTGSDRIWRSVEMDSGQTIPVEVREQLEGLVATVLSSTEDTRIRAYGRLVAAAIGANTARSVHSESRPDERSRLWRDLGDAAGADLWQPFRVEGRSQARVAPSGAPVANVTTVSVFLDGRMPLEDLLSGLRKMWPKLVAAELVRPTRRMQKRTVAQLRHVCLECIPDDTWETRWRSWQDRYRKRGWGFRDRRSFITNFHRAERALTGASGGLAWFYSSDARLTEKELTDRINAGDRAAMVEARRREDMYFGWLTDRMRTLERQTRKEKGRG